MKRSEPTVAEASKEEEAQQAQVQQQQPQRFSNSHPADLKKSMIPVVLSVDEDQFPGVVAVIK